MLVYSVRHVPEALLETQDINGRLPRFQVATSPRREVAIHRFASREDNLSTLAARSRLEPAAV